MIASAPTPEAASRAVGDFFGLPPLRQADLGHLAVAAAILVTAVIVARLLKVWLRRWLARVAQPKLKLAGHDVSLASNHVAAVVAPLTALVLVTVAAEAYDWPRYSLLLLDLAIPLGAAVVVQRVASAFNLSPSAGLAIAVVCGLAVLTNRYEQLGWVERSLDSIAVSLGGTRVSVLGVVNAAFAAIVLYALVRLAIRGARALIRRRADFDITQRLLAEKIATIAIIVVAAFAAIDMLGIDTTALSVFSGTVGLGLGFGLQKIFSNLVSGIILLMDRSIKPGDVIVVDQAVGEVKRIGTRAVSVITRDGKEHLIPNELLMTERVENWNYSSRDIRIRMTVRVAYESDIDLVERLLEEATRESPRVLDSPSPAVRITDISNSGVKIELRFWISDPEDGLGNIQSEIYKRILVKFRKHDVVMPNEGRDVEITKVPPIIFRGAEGG